MLVDVFDDIVSHEGSIPSISTTVLVYTKGSAQTLPFFMHLLDFLFPPRCAGCKKVGTYICISCKKSVIFLPQRCPLCDRQAVYGLTHPVCVRKLGLDGLVSVYAYSGVIRNAVKMLKYRFVSDLAETLVDLIPSTTYQFLPKDTHIYPIPLHKERLRWRGFNQAEKLTQFVSPRLGLKVAKNLLVRVKKRTSQADIAHKVDRIKNAQGLFQISNINYATKPLNILLFDDVWTTGATMKEAATVLKRAGVKKVWGLTLAR